MATNTPSMNKRFISFSSLNGFCLFQIVNLIRLFQPVVIV